jgi:hypothetical protein
MTAPDEQRPDGAAPASPLDISPGRASRATTHPDGDTPDAQPPLKQHGDALLDGSGSRQGRDPDPARDAATPD